MNDRARVPFALVGVLLLVSSATISASFGGQDPVTEHRTEAAIEDVRSDSLAALRTAVRDAARWAARNPVTTPANTSVGRSLNATRSFREYLALRVHDRFRSALADVGTRGEVRVVASLPPTDEATALRDAIDRVALSRAGPNGSALRVSVENVTLVATRNGRVVERVRFSPTVAVASPVLLLHDRTERFDRRLDRPATAPGLARGVTARLYAVGWTRGFTQYAGGPIVNVIANRHVELAVNHALLAEQRSVFGLASRPSRRAVRAAAARTGTIDLLTASGIDADRADDIAGTVEGPVTNASLSPISAFERNASYGDQVPSETGDASPEDELAVGADRPAEVSFQSFVEDAGDTSNLTRTIDRVYGATARIRSDVRRISTTGSGTARPGPGWTPVDSRETTQIEVELREPDPSAPDTSGPATGDRHVLAETSRRVTERTVATREWRLGNRTRVTREVERTVFDVDLFVVGHHGPSEHAPVRPIRGVHERGAGPLDGPNLAGVPQDAVHRLVVDRGGSDTLARRAVAGTLDEGKVRIDGSPPDGLRPWVYRDLVELRERIADVNVTVSRGEVGTYQENPARGLAAALDSRREELVGAPATYDGVASKARYAARAAYVDAVIDRLDGRASDRQEVGARFSEVLADRGISIDEVREAMQVRRRAASPPRAVVDGIAGPTRVVAEGAPPYLTLAGVDRSKLDVAGAGTHRGLAARNLNVFTSPHGDVADTVVGDLFDDDRARLRTAAETLRAVRKMPDPERSDELVDGRRELRSAVASAVSDRRDRLRDRLERADVGETGGERRAVVADGLSRWNTTASRALALANGSAADAVASAAVRRHPDHLEGVVARDRLRLSLRAAARGGDGVSRKPVNRTATTLRRVGRRALSEATERAAERAIDQAGNQALGRAEKRVGRSLARVPAGLPVTPVPPHWYATSNVWIVQTRGSYARFTARAKRGLPGRSLRYTRDGSPVRYDWDDDGTREVVGRSAPVDLEVRTAVVVVVPQGGRGVGDTDGNADERSAGWNTARS